MEILVEEMQAFSVDPNEKQFNVRCLFHQLCFESTWIGVYFNSQHLMDVLETEISDIVFG